jgi:hypothetical protein
LVWRILGLRTPAYSWLVYVLAAFMND